MKLLGENVFEEAAGDNVTRATPPPNMSTETGMPPGEGIDY
tara:strand:+ start:8310 stop:8432 length:123 start_codon:yes stop_codon:yes gene_type:complete